MALGIKRFYFVCAATKKSPPTLPHYPQNTFFVDFWACVYRVLLQTPLGGQKKTVPHRYRGAGGLPPLPASVLAETVGHVYEAAMR